jgi:hypothetical protein
MSSYYRSNIDHPGSKIAASPWADWPFSARSSTKLRFKSYCAGQPRPRSPTLAGPVLPLACRASWQQSTKSEEPLDLRRPISARFAGSRHLCPHSHITNGNPVRRTACRTTDAFPVAVTAALIGGLMANRETFENAGRDSCGNRWNFGAAYGFPATTDGYSTGSRRTSPPSTCGAASSGSGKLQDVRDPNDTSTSDRPHRIKIPAR